MSGARLPPVILAISLLSGAASGQERDQVRTAGGHLDILPIGHATVALVHGQQ